MTTVQQIQQQQINQKIDMEWYCLKNNIYNPCSIYLNKGFLLSYSVKAAQKILTLLV